MRELVHTRDDIGRPLDRPVLYALALDGHDATRSDAIAQARAYLTAGGMVAAAAEDATVDGQHRIARAWWGDDARGFVQAHHDGAAPVTVVHVDGAR